jgi:hypothetical protein
VHQYTAAAAAALLVAALGLPNHIFCQPALEVFSGTTPDKIDESMDDIDRYCP